jgi:hypothetical protein
MKPLHIALMPCNAALFVFDALQQIMPNNYMYRGDQYDPDLGLYYRRARTAPQEPP